MEFTHHFRLSKGGGFGASRRQIKGRLLEEMYGRCVRAVLESRPHVLSVDWVPAVKEERDLYKWICTSGS